MALHRRGRSHPETSRQIGQQPACGHSTQIGYSGIQKPLAEAYVLQRGKVKVETCPIQVLQTPVTAEAFSSLRSLIEQDSHMLNKSTRHYVQKLANTTKRVFADCALLLNENLSLFKRNNEREYRQSTRSTVVGKAKVTSYEDIKVAQAKRDTKKAAAIKGKRGRKRKNSVPVAAQAKRTKRSELKITKDGIEAEGI